MAFVFKSSKDLDKPIEKEYDILTSKRNHKRKKNTLKKIKPSKINYQIILMLSFHFRENNQLSEALKKEIFCI